MGEPHPVRRGPKEQRVESSGKGGNASDWQSAAWNHSEASFWVSVSPTADFGCAAFIIIWASCSKHIFSWGRMDFKAFLSQLTKQKAVIWGIEKSPICCFIPSSGLQWPGPGRGEARIPELNPSLPGGWQGLKYLSYHLMLPRWICRELEGGLYSSHSHLTLGSQAAA